MDDKYLIWSNEHSCWWRADKRGYTRVVARAGRYDRKTAMSICKGRDGWRENASPPEIPVLEKDAIECAPHLFTEPTE